MQADFQVIPTTRNLGGTHALQHAGSRSTRFESYFYVSEPTSDIL